MSNHIERLAGEVYRLNRIKKLVNDARESRNSRLIGYHSWWDMVADLGKALFWGAGTMALLLFTVSLLTGCVSSEPHAEPLGMLLVGLGVGFCLPAMLWGSGPSAPKDRP